MHGNVNTFMEYSAEYSPYAWCDQVKKCIIAKSQSKEDASENARSQLVKLMKMGKQMFFNCDTMVPTFSDYDNDTLPLKSMVFKRTALMADYKKLVKSEEDVDLFGNKGFYEMKPDFNMGVIMNMSKQSMDDGILQMLLDVVPNIEEFKKVYILPEE